MKPTRFAAVVAGFVIGAAPVFGAHAVAQSAPGANLGGYVTEASALAFSVQPVFPALLPTSDVPVEGTIALSIADLRSGGNAFGRASTVWPGSGAADAGPLIGEGAGQPQIGELVPKWPVQAQANQDAGVVTAGLPPALVMQATGYPDHAGGDARIADLLVPGFAHIEHVASTSSTIVTADDVTSSARVVLHGVSLLNGHITIEQLRSVSQTTSTGSTATSKGDVAISGLKIGGVTVTVTDRGFQIEGAPPGANKAPGAGGKPFPDSSPAETVSQTLKSFGARLTVFKSIGNAKDGVADRLGQGLVLSIDNPVGGSNHIPPGRFDIYLGSTSSSTLATPPFAAGETSSSASLGSIAPVSAGSSSIGGGPVPAGDSLSNVGQSLGVGSSGSASALGGGGGQALNDQHAAYHFGGVPIALVVALLILAALAARYIRRFMNSIMSAGTTNDQGGAAK